LINSKVNGQKLGFNTPLNLKYFIQDHNNRQAKLLACSPHYPFDAELQAGKL